MNVRIWKLAAALCLVASAVACKQDSGHDPAPPAPSLAVNLSAASVVANGSNQVNVIVTDTGAAGVNLSTTLGTFPGGAATYAIPAGTGVTQATVPLLTCDSRTAPACQGAVTITASSSTGVVTKSLNFTTLASTCLSNCGADAGCAGFSCTLTASGTGSCTTGTPSVCSSAPPCTKIPLNATTETSCSDGADNECNGQTDCGDATCDGQPCDPSSATSVCKAGSCTDLASGLGIAISSSRQRLPANGTTQSVIVVEVSSGSDPAPNMGVTLSTSVGTLSALAGTTDRDGRAVFTFTAPVTSGVAVITASVTVVPTVRAATSITIPRLGSFQVPATFAVPGVMGVRTSGWNEFGRVGVQVLDDQGLPYPDGLTVHFEHRLLGGSSFGAPTVACAGSPANCIAHDAAISGGADEVDATGMARAPIYSGTMAGTLVVTATTTAGGLTRDVTLPGIAVVGAKANLANFSIQCAPRNVPALGETDCSTSWVESQVTCAALMKDRFNNLLGTSTQVTFVSEAAAVSQATWSPAYDPANPGDEQADLGTATQIFQTLGSGLPFDVAPLTGGVEPSVSHALDGCGPRTHNPRDGVVTLVAIADGEEAFFDANGDGAYTAAVGATLGEPFVDQGEPFVDQDDNGRWDPGEWFYDSDGNKAYTLPNGQWDAQAKIWTQTIVVYTGWAARELDAATTPVKYLGTRWVDDVTPYASACTPTPAPALFSVDSEVAGPPKEPATSAVYTAVASDLNLNVLTKETTYDAKAVGSGVKAKVEYLGLESYADMLGMFYRYWPCDQPAAGPATCASQCRTPVGTGASGPCRMTPSISGFWCGIDAPVLITGGSEPDGQFSVDFLVDTPIQSYGGEGKVFHQVAPVSGYSDNLATTP